MRRRGVFAVWVLALAALAASPAAASAAFGLHGLDVTFTKESGAAEMQAGSHPSAMTTNVELNTFVDSKGRVLPDEQLKNLRVELPAGLVGNPTAVPQCPLSNFFEIVENTYTTCPDSSAVGVSGVTAEFVPVVGGSQGFFWVPVYNLRPPPGSVAKLGFAVLGFPITIDVQVNPDSPHNVIATVSNVTQAAFVDSSRISLWGNPADPVHDPFRGSCVDSEAGPTAVASRGICPAGIPVQPFLTLPRSCTGPMETRFTAKSWQAPGAPPFVGTAISHNDFEPSGMTGCSKLGLVAGVALQPTTHSAESSSGLSFDLDIDDKGLTSPTGTAQSDIRKTVVTLPKGVTVNPSAGEGLAACSEGQLARETASSEPGDGCPEASKVGSVEVETPLLEGKLLRGSVYVATQDTNLVHSMLAVYMVIKDPELGILVKLPGRVEADPVSGQITTTFGDPPYEVPQLPFSHLRFRFREGARAPLVTPPVCGSYAVNARLVPWAGGQPFEANPRFQISSGPNGGPCPAGTPPFDPDFEAGTINNAAGAYSPFFIRLSRRDAEQGITRFSQVLPPGVLGKLAGVARCSDVAVAQARSKTGLEELATPSCPANSQIGRVVAGAGVGSALTYVQGKVYLGGPYAGAPLSVVVVTPGVAGPFDIGTVVVREALSLDPDSGVVEVDGSHADPIPRILKGIPLKLREIRVYVDRSNFTLNATSCDPSATRATVFGDFLDVFNPADDAPVGVSARYQASNCGALGFKPKLSLSLSGGTRRGSHPALRAVVDYPKKGRYANIARAAVTLPHSAFLEQGHIRTVCTRVQFAASSCPRGSIYGRARAISPLLDEPLEGPVYLRSSNHPLPDLVAALHGIVDINVVGRIDAVRARIRSRFESVPDAPVSKFILTMKGGKKGLIVNSRNLCAHRSVAIAHFVGQNGKTYDAEPTVSASSCTQHKPAKR